MKPLRAESAAYWIAGTLVACAGVATARLIAPRLADPLRTWIVVAGELLGVGGLLVIAVGVRRRVFAATAGPSADASRPELPKPV